MHPNWTSSRKSNGRGETRNKRVTNMVFHGGSFRTPMPKIQHINKIVMFIFRLLLHPLCARFVILRTTDIAEWNIPKIIELADPQFDKCGHIDGLIGAELFFDLMPSGQIKLANNLPIIYPYYKKHYWVGWLLVVDYILVILGRWLPVFQTLKIRISFAPF